VRQPAMNEGAVRAPAMSLSERAGPLRLAAAVPVRQLRLVLAGALLVMVLAALDQNIVNTALPRMASELGGLQHLSWVVAAFMLTSTATTPLYGKLSDMYGRRALFVVAIVVFLGGSLLCGTARSMPQLIGFRALQGLGAGGLLVTDLREESFMLRNFGGDRVTRSAVGDGSVAKFGADLGSVR
jgi:Na+/melibiose symporter-like transporter